MAEVSIDVVTKRPDGGFSMILVEQGPWSGDPDDELHRLQGRLYDYVDVAVDGHSAKLYPESRGRDVVIQVDAYQTPAEAVSRFVKKFAAYFDTSEEYQSALGSQDFVSSLALECREHESA